MLIDWFTVIAQVANLLILVWLMKRFLYGPILQAIDAREARIAAEIADADARKAEALAERDALRRKNAEFEERSGELMQQARNNADAERDRLVRETHEFVDRLRAKLEAQFARDASDLIETVAKEAQQEVFAVARRCLIELSGLSLEARMVAVFVERLQSMEQSAKAALVTAVRNSQGGPLVKSTFELPEALRQTVQKALQDELSSGDAIRYVVDPDLVCGIELIANGHKFGWSIADYLTALQTSVVALAQGVGENQPSQKSAELDAPIGQSGDAAEPSPSPPSVAVS